MFMTMIIQRSTTTDTMDKRERGSEMKTFMATYTEDNGRTHHQVLVSADTYTQAYIEVSVKSKNGIITDLFEVV